MLRYVGSKYYIKNGIEFLNCMEQDDHFTIKIIIFDKYSMPILETPESAFSPENLE